jgi:hypothetical protein
MYASFTLKENCIKSLTFFEIKNIYCILRGRRNPVIPATQEAEMGGLLILGQPGNSGGPCLKIKIFFTGLRIKFSGRVLACG